MLRKVALRQEETLKRIDAPTHPGEQMSSRPVVPWLLLAVLTGACASSPKPERPEGPPLKVLFQSPIALLLEHHEELALTTDQLIQLDKQEQALQDRNRPLHVKLWEARGRRQGPPPGQDMGGGWGGQGRGRGMGGMGGPGMGGGPRRGEPPPVDEASRQATLREIEDNESAAFLEAEKVLDEKQKTRARELFSQQREERLRVREALRGRMRPPPES